MSTDVGIEVGGEAFLSPLFNTDPEPETEAAPLAENPISAWILLASGRWESLQEGEGAQPQGRSRFRIASSAARWLGGREPERCPRRAR